MGAIARVVSARARPDAPPNSVLLEAALDAMEEACRLANEGHAILGLAVRAGQPVIQLGRSPRLAEMLSTGAAAYFAHGIGRDGQRRRMGELLNRGRVRVTWLEVGH
jgi:hypothetical protein